MKFRVPADNTFEGGKGRNERNRGRLGGRRWEIAMSALHQIVPIVLLVQFFVILGGMAVAMICAAPETLLPGRKASRRLITPRGRAH